MLPLSDLPSQFESVVKMKNIHLNYGKHLIFSGLNWTVNEGEKWLLKGRNGAGKSSLLSLITGDHPQAYANEIYLFGKRRGSGESIWESNKKRVMFLLNCMRILIQTLPVLMQLHLAFLIQSDYIKN